MRALALALLLFAASPASAQYLRKYVFIGPAPNRNPTPPPTSYGILPSPATSATPGSENTFTGGLGFEERFGRFVGAGLDFAAIVPGAGKILDHTVGAVAPSGYLHLAGSNWLDAKADLYAVGGYSALFHSSAANGVNVGGGLNYWFHERTALLLEFRYLRVLGSAPFTPYRDYYQVRFGLSFR